MIEVIAEHSVDTSLLPRGANILDIGCLGFEFTNYFRIKGYNVVAIDIQELEGSYYRLAISDSNGVCGVNKTSDKQATHIKDGNELRKMTILSFNDMVEVKSWDLIKMDIEGEEIKVLKSLTHPYCKQISVEFHAHVNQTKEQLDSLLDWLSEWYTIHNRVWESRHGCSPNYWDILLIAK